MCDDSCRKSTPSKCRIMIVDDHPIVRRGLSALIAREAGLAVCCEAEDSPQALALLDTQRPDLVIVDLALRNSSGLNLVKEMRRSHPRIPVLVVSMHEESVYAERVLRAGARGYVMKHVVDEIIVEAIRRVLGGGVYVSEAVRDLILNECAMPPEGLPARSVKTLSDRELDVFRLIGRGVKSQTIASGLHVSTKTVDTYRSRIKSKLHLRTSNELTQFAVEWLLTEEKGL